MSIFKIKLKNAKQGLLDVYDNQRTVYITGPNKINRKLKDGDTFTDCNYWKRFAYPNVGLEESFIEVLEDDGTIYSDQIIHNTYPKVYDISTSANSTYSENQVKIQEETGSFALFTQMTNRSSDEVKVKLNGLNTAILDLPNGSTQTFNFGELPIGLIEIQNESENIVDIQIIVSLQIITKS